MKKAKNADEYIAAQKQAVSMNPECGNSHYNLAVGLLGKKLYDEAETELHEAIGCSSNLAEAYVLLGGICLQKGDIDGCLNYNQQAVQCRAGFSIGYGNIGFVKLQKGDIDGAIEALQKAIKWNKNFLQAYTTLGNAYLMKGLIDEGIEASLEALKLEPSFAIAHNNLAIAYLEKNDIELASKHAEKAIEGGYNVSPNILKDIEKHIQNKA
jgi:tetratricopeptide (TPR) repeat protein